MKSLPVSIAVVVSELVKFPFKRHQPIGPDAIIVPARRAWVLTRERCYDALAVCKSRIFAHLLRDHLQYCPIPFLESARFACVTSLVSERPGAEFSWRKCLLKLPMYAVYAQRFERPCHLYNSANTTITFSPALSWQLARTQQQNKRQSKGPASIKTGTAYSDSPAPSGSRNDSGQPSIGDKVAGTAIAIVTSPLPFRARHYDASSVYAREALTSYILAATRHFSSTHVRSSAFSTASRALGMNGGAIEWI